MVGASAAAVIDTVTAPTAAAGASAAHQHHGECEEEHAESKTTVGRTLEHLDSGSSDGSSQEQYSAPVTDRITWALAGIEEPVVARRLEGARRRGRERNRACGVVHRGERAERDHLPRVPGAAGQ